MENKNIIEVTQPCFEYLIEDPTKVRYEPEVKGEYIVEMKNNPWKCIIVQTHIGGLSKPKEGEILFKYTEERGYFIKK